MSIVNVNQIQPVGSGQTVTINAANISAGSATVTAGSFVGNLSGNITIGAGTTSAPSLAPTGDSNTGIFFPAADTIAFSQGGVESLRIDNTGSIGIASTSIDLKISATVDSVVKIIGDSNNTSGEPGKSQLYLLNDGGINGFYLLNANVFGGPGSLNFGVSANRVDTDLVNLTSGGDVQIVSGNLVFSTSGKGIDFSATANSSGTMSSELLSDYEEGSWTPGISGTSGGTYTAGSGNVGRYVKVGNLVTASATIEWTARPVAYTGLLIITGLPFSALNVTNYRATGIIPGQAVGMYASGSYDQLKATLDWNNSFVYVVQAAETISAGSNFNHTPTVLTTGAIYGFTITYISN